MANVLKVVLKPVKVASPIVSKASGSGPPLNTSVVESTKAKLVVEVVGSPTNNLDSKKLLCQRLNPSLMLNLK